MPMTINSAVPSIEPGAGAASSWGKASDIATTCAVLPTALEIDVVV